MDSYHINGMQAALIIEIHQQSKTSQRHLQAINKQTKLIVKSSFYPLSGNLHPQHELYLEIPNKTDPYKSR